MDTNNVTCVQRTRFFFYFHKKNIWKHNEVNSIELRNVKNYFNYRLERIAKMMDILADLHTDWAITGKNNYILLETESLDFNDALNALKDKGFHSNEYILKVEYNRRWGVL